MARCNIHVALKPEPS